MSRKSKEHYYLDIALQVAMRSTCLKRRFGAVIVNNDQIISTGYNGAPRGRISSLEAGFCLREQSKQGQGYDNCRSVHAEANAIIHASRQDMDGAVLYLAGTEVMDDQLVDAEPCNQCRRMIVNAAISQVIMLHSGDKIVTHSVENYCRGTEIRVEPGWVICEHCQTPFQIEKLKVYNQPYYNPLFLGGFTRVIDCPLCGSQYELGEGKDG